MRAETRSHTTDTECSKRSADFLIELEGEAAAYSGEPASANPHKSGTFEHLYWLSGWMAARYRDFAG